MSPQRAKIGVSGEQNIHTVVLIWVIIAGICAFLANVIAASMMGI